jgi:hypothetical protein
MRNLKVALESASCSQVGRKQKWAEDMVARFPRGTFERIARVSRETEDRTDFVREAVSRELERRERAMARKPPRGRRA